MSFGIMLMGCAPTSLPGGVDLNTVLGPAERALMANESALIKQNRLASLAMESITDKFIQQGKITVESVMNTTRGEDGLIAKGYVGVEFVDEMALRDFIALTKPIVERVCGSVYSNVMFHDPKLRATATARDLNHGEPILADEEYFDTTAAGNVTLQLSGYYDYNIFCWNWHSWELLYVDSDSVKKAKQASFEIKAAMNQAADPYISVKLGSSYANRDSGKTPYIVTNPVTVRMYSQGITDDWKDHTWWNTSSKIHFQVTLTDSSNATVKYGCYRDQGGSFVALTF